MVRIKFNLYVRWETRIEMRKGVNDNLAQRRSGITLHFGTRATVADYLRTRIVIKIDVF